MPTSKESQSSVLGRGSKSVAPRKPILVPVESDSEREDARRQRSPRNIPDEAPRAAVGAIRPSRNTLRREIPSGLAPRRETGSRPVSRHPPVRVFRSSSTVGPRTYDVAFGSTIHKASELPPRSSVIRPREGQSCSQLRQYPAPSGKTPPRTTLTVPNTPRLLLRGASLPTRRQPNEKAVPVLRVRVDIEHLPTRRHPTAARQATPIQRQATSLGPTPRFPLGSTLGIRSASSTRRRMDAHPLPSGRVNRRLDMNGGAPPRAHSRGQESEQEDI